MVSYMFVWFYQQIERNTEDILRGTIPKKRHMATWGCQVDINKTTANPLAQIVHRSRALQFARRRLGGVWVQGGGS